MRYGKLVVESDGGRFMLITVGDFFIVYNGANGRAYSCRLGGSDCPTEFAGEAVARALPFARFVHSAGTAGVRRGRWSWLIDVGGDLFAVVEVGGQILTSYLGDWSETTGVIPTLDYPEEVVSELLRLAEDLQQGDTLLKADG